MTISLLALKQFMRHRL